MHISATVLDDQETLELTVRDSGVGVSRELLNDGKSTGIGLSNIERRLDRHFGDRASLIFRSEPQQGTTVCIRIPVVATASIVRDRARAS